jgi:solute carrier family 50 protein (sugar transporter)
MTSLVKVVFGVLGNITAAFLFLSPLPTFWRIVRNRKVEAFSGVPYLTAALNCSLWTFYGLPVVDFQVLLVTINAAGTGLELFYITVYLLFSEGKPRLKVVKLFIAMALGFIVMAGLVLGLVHDLNTRRAILGVLGATLATLMYGAPLTIMKMVIETKSVEFMPFLLSLFVFLNSLAWTIYAIMPKKDFYVLVPNVIGLVLGTGQLVLYAIYRRSTQQKPFLATADKLAVEITSEKIAPAPDASPAGSPVKKTALDNV